MSYPVWNPVRNVAGIFQGQDEGNTMPQIQTLPPPPPAPAPLSTPLFFFLYKFTEVEVTLLYDEMWFIQGALSFSFPALDANKFEFEFRVV